MTIIDHIQDMPWAMRQAKLDEITAFLTQRINGEQIDKTFEAAGKNESRSGAGYEVVDGMAVITIIGTVSKRMNMLSNMSGGTSSELIRKNLEAAIKDRSVSAILLDIESPGGSVDGTAALSDFVFQSRGQKPIIAFANGMMASAAYWIGSAADVIVATEDAMVGSIGVAMTHVDRSQSDKQEGLVRTEIFAGKYKRIATGSQPLSEDGKAYLQGMVDHFYGMFVDAVARNRGVPVDAALKMADGKEFIGKQALEVGLVDFIGTKEFALGKAKERSFRNMDLKTLQENHADLYSQVIATGVEQGRTEMEKAVAEARQTGATAERERITSLLDAGADPKATREAINDGITAGEAYKRFFEAEKNKRSSALQGMAAAATKPVEPEVPATPHGDAVKAYEAEISRLMGEGKTRAQAVSSIAVSNAGLHEKYLQAINKKGA